MTIIGEIPKSNNSPLGFLKRIVNLFIDILGLKYLIMVHNFLGERWTYLPTTVSKVILQKALLMAFVPSYMPPNSSISNNMDINLYNHHLY